MQHAKAGLKAIYLSGWQVAADANSAGEMYPDQSLYPYDSAPKLVESMNNALVRADQIQHMELKDGDMKEENKVDYMLPIIADGEAGFGGPLNVFELAKKFIKAGAAGVHFEDQLASEKKCGHMGGKVLVPTGTMIKNLKAARLAADIANVPLIILARTDANAAKLITNDHDENDKPFLTGERSPEGFFYVKQGIDQAISRGLAYAPYSDALARAIIKEDISENDNPLEEVVMYDEPTAGLDPVASTVVEDLMRNLHTESKAVSSYEEKKGGVASYIVVTHQHSTIRRAVDRLIFLHAGKVVWEGTSKEFDTCEEPIVRQFATGSLQGPIVY